MDIAVRVGATPTMSKGESMGNFIGLVYATLQKEGIDTTGMSTDEAVKKYNELQKREEPKQDGKELTPNEEKRLSELGIEENLSFGDMVEEVLDNKTSNIGHITLSKKTPQILQSVGLENKKMVISQDTIKKLNNKHELSVEQIKALPKKMAEPFLIMNSFTNNDSIVEYIKDIDKNKNPIMVSVIINKTVRQGEDYVRANVITSAYGRNNFAEHIKKGIETNSILYYNKKRLSNLPVNEGLQLPSIMKDLNPYNNIIRKFKKKSTV